MNCQDTRQILVFGNVNVDLVLGELAGWPAVGTEVQMDRSETRPGGSAGNTSLALSSLNVTHRLVASVGQDFFGEWLKEQFDGKCCEWLSCPDPTTVTVGLVHEGGDRAFFTSPGHLLSARVDQLLPNIHSAPEACSIALISGQFLMPFIRDDALTLMGALKDRGWQVAIDPGWPPEGWTAENIGFMRAWLSNCDYALINEDELYGLTGAAEFEAGCALVRSVMSADGHLVIKMGQAGARCYVGQQVYSCASPTVDVIDSVGAGDTFNAAFIAGVVRGVSVQTALAQGVETAARVISTYPRRYTAD